MFKKYIWCLFKQFCEANGLDITNTNKIYSDEFADWIMRQKSLLNIYESYLKFLEFDNSVDDILEIGKGQYDSLSQQGIRVISPFAETMGKRNSTLYIDREIPLILHQNGIIIPMEHILMTYNPYFESDILNWNLIHNRGENNISIGMFGKLTDEDSERKVKVLENISKQMNEDFTFDLDTEDGNYFCSLNSKRTIKRKILNK